MHFLNTLIADDAFVALAIFAALMLALCVGGYFADKHDAKNQKHQRKYH